MVLTIGKLELQVKELEKQYNEGQTNLGNNVVNFIMQYQAGMNQVKANIALIHKQIAELVREKQEEDKKKKELESNKKETKEKVISK